MPARVIDLVGPKGYVHGWHYVGPQAVGAKVFHPQLGAGTVTGHDGSSVKVKFDAGGERNFEAKHGSGTARLERKTAPTPGSPPAKVSTAKAPSVAAASVQRATDASADIRPEKVRELKKAKVSDLRAALQQDAISPRFRAEINEAIRQKTSAGKPDWKPGQRSPLTAGSYAALQPKRGGWTTSTRAQTLDALKKDPAGRQVATVLNSFQQGGSTAIPRLRTDIEKAARGENLPEGRHRAVDALLGAISGSDASGKHLYRGASIPGSPDEVAARYKSGSTVSISLGSFTSDKKVGYGFATPNGSAGQRVRAKTTTPVVLDWGEGDKSALPIENLGKSGVFADEHEYVSSGDFTVTGTRQVNGVLVLSVKQVKKP